MSPEPRICSYEWSGGHEAMLRWGPEHAPVAVLALPLFEEANRTRAFGAGIARALAHHGDSERAIAGFSVLDLQIAYVAAVEQAGASLVGYGVGIRSGALLDALGPLAGRWHLAPQTGVELLLELRRLLQTATEAPLPRDHWWFDGALLEDVPDPAVEIAGNLIGVDLLTDLCVKEPFDMPGIPRRVVRLAQDPRPADRHVPGPALWRRADPGNDHGLAQLLATDIATWIRACEG